MEPVLTSLEIETLLDKMFPQASGRFRIDTLMPAAARIVMDTKDSDLRPGATVSGPTLFALADYAMYVAALAHVGAETLMVTTNAHINFMRKPSPGRLLAEAKILKLGKTLCVGDVRIHGGEAATLFAQASITYSIPPAK